ncbi:hydroxyethylthiazole kinase [Salinarchaeum chitinilyticum]
MSDANSAFALDVTLPDAFGAIAEQPPLVHCMTNDVTVSEVANVTLHWGGLPVMAVDPREVEDMAGAAAGLYLNMGTVDEDEDAMIAAGQAANEGGAPVAFDPVGAGATPTRDAVAERILDEVGVSIVKGNYGEVTALAGEDAEVQGVESVGEYSEIAETAMALAADSDAVVVASGEVDVVADDTVAYEIACGDPMMGSFVGSGCMLGVTEAVFAGGLGVERILDAAIAGTAAFGIAGERAAAADEQWNGPASYRTAFQDAVAAMEAGSVDDGELASRVELVAER